MKIWKRTTDINEINKNMKNTMSSHLGIIITEISRDTLEGTMPVTKNLPNRWYDTPNLHMCTIKDFVDFCNDKKIKIDKSMCLTNEKISEISKNNIKYKNMFSQLGIFLIE